MMRSATSALVLIVVTLFVGISLSRSSSGPDYGVGPFEGSGQSYSPTGVPRLPRGNLLLGTKPKPPDFVFSDHIVANGLENPPPFKIEMKRQDREIASKCLARAIYYEAAGESDKGQGAVAQVVLNRVRHPLYPNSICEVVSEGQELGIGCQFSFMCDGSLLRKPSAGGWARAVAKANAFLAGETAPHVGMATHYHADYVYPYWADRLQRIAVVDTHVFYRWGSSLGRKRIYTQSYRGEGAAEVKNGEGDAILQRPDNDFSASVSSTSDAPSPTLRFNSGILGKSEVEIVAPHSSSPIADREVIPLEADRGTAQPQVDSKVRQLP